MTCLSSVLDKLKFQSPPLAYVLFYGLKPNVYAISPFAYLTET